MVQISDVERQLAIVAAQADDLRETGARMLADNGAAGAEVISWLIRHGSAGNDARQLVVDLVRERRAAKESAR